MSLFPSLVSRGPRLGALLGRVSRAILVNLLLNEDAVHQCARGDVCQHDDVNLVAAAYNSTV